MPTTPNYGWTIPTEGGDTGIWDTILNAAFDEIDAEVFRVEGEADAAQADATLGIGFWTAFGSSRILCGAVGVVFGDSDEWEASPSSPGALNKIGTDSDRAFLEVRAAIPGLRITQFVVRGFSQAGIVATVGLYRKNDTGTTQVGTNATLPEGVVGNVTVDIADHDFISGDGYFWRLDVGAGTATFISILPTVIETP